MRRTLSDYTLFTFINIDIFHNKIFSSCMVRLVLLVGSLILLEINTLSLSYAMFVLAFSRISKSMLYFNLLFRLFT